MGAFVDYDAYVDTLRQNRAADFQAGVTTRGQRLNALFRNFLPTPATPTTSAALDDTSDVAIGPLPTVSAGRLTMLGARVNPGGTSGVGLIIADILNHSGGLNATLTTEQTTGLPTAALTRHTSGEGVMAGLICYAQNGSTASTVTMKYTNQAGTQNRVSPAVQFGGTGYREAAALILMPLAAGDTGVRSVESVTFAATTTSNANVGVVLFKPLAMIACNNFEGAHVIDAVSSGGFIGSLAQAEPGACLSLLAVVSSNQTISGSIILDQVWAPNYLFSASEPGAWYDPSDLSTLFQDAAGTTPVTGAGDPVGRINDKSGNGNHATQSTATARPIYRVDGNGRPYLEFDGTDDFLRASFVVTQPVSRVTGLKLPSSVMNTQLLGGGAFINAPALYFHAASSLGIFSGSVLSSLSVNIPGTYVVREVHDGASSSLRVNAGSPLTGNAGTTDGDGLTLGASFLANPANYSRVNLYGLVQVGRLLTATEITQLERWMAVKSEVTL